ncbi:LysR family transcriptional regulator [Actinopolymorpha pittospori]
MALGDASLVSLRVFREVAERGTLTAAAAALGYTESGVSRQIAALERAAGTPLLERHHKGVRTTPAGQIVLHHAAATVDQMDAAAREVAGIPDETGTVMLGWFASTGALLLPRALSTLHDKHPAIIVKSCEESTPRLVRALRARKMDLALLASTPPYRPLDTETPALVTETLTERSLRLAVPASHPLAGGDYVDVTDLHGQRWISGSGGPTRGGPAGSRQLGAWPGLDERPEIAHVARDWLAKFHLVAAGFGLTTIPAVLEDAVPPGVRVLPVRGSPSEEWRVLLARLPGDPSEPVIRVAEALRTAALTI